MNTLAHALLWCLVQVTLLASFAAVLYSLLSRRTPAGRSSAIFTALALVAGLTALAASPWPRWSWKSLFPSQGRFTKSLLSQEFSADFAPAIAESEIASNLFSSEPDFSRADEVSTARSPAAIDAAAPAKSQAPANAATGTKGPSASWMTICSLLALGILVSGLRGGSSVTSIALAGSTIATGAVETSLAPAIVAAVEEPLSLAYVPHDSTFVLAIRPATILARPEMTMLGRFVQQQDDSQKQLGIPMDRLEQVTIACLDAFSELNRFDPAAVIVRVREPGDALTIIKHLFADSTEGEYEGQKYRKAANGRVGCLLKSGRLAILSDSEEHLRRVLLAGEDGPAQASWLGAWREASGDHARLLLDVRAIKEQMQLLLRQRAPNARGVLPAFSPLWENAALGIVGLTVDSKFDVQARVACPSAGEAKKVADTLSAALTIGRNALAQARETGQFTGDAGAMMLRGFREADVLLDQIKVEPAGSEVRATAVVASEALATSFAMLLAAVQPARVAARLSHSKNNLKLIGLAFHNYCDAHGRFPPAARYGRDGNGNSQHPHSWRVAILPFIDQTALYNEYKFDEPWDSPANKKVLDKMPAPFRDPNDPQGSTNASYFVLTGEGTVFPDGDGTKLRDILDGTSNTLLVVEVKQDIPWTKPEDIPYAADKPVPKLGGQYDFGFFAVLCDGSVRGFSKLDEQFLRNLIQRNDGNPFQVP